MNILLFPSSFLPVIGGVSEVALRLGIEYRHRNNLVKVVTLKYPRKLARNESIAGLSVHRILFTNIFPDFHNLRQACKYIAGLLIAPVSLFKLILLINKFRPDFVHLHFVGNNALYLLIAKTLFNFKLLVTLHGDDVEGLPYRSKYYRWLLNKTCKKADYITACSNYLLNKAKILSPSIEHKSSFVHNGIDLEDYNRIIPKKFNFDYIVSGGRFVKKKGFDVLIKAYKKVISDGFLHKLVLIGDGEEKSNLIKLTEKLQIDWCEGKNTEDASGPKIIFWGKATREEMISLIAGSEMAVVPSLLEPFGIIVLEAMSAGTPVIGSMVGGIPEIISGDNGILVQPNDQSALTGAMEKLLNDKKLRDTLVKNGLNRAMDFNWGVAADKYLNFINN